jgi:hypothetical protein
MITYLVSIGLIFALALLGIAVDRAYRRFALRHPQLGPFRSQDGGCGCCAGHGCADGGSCSTDR